MNLIKYAFLAGVLATVFLTGANLQADMIIYSTPIPASDAFSNPTASFTLPEFNPARERLPAWKSALH